MSEVRKQEVTNNTKTGLGIAGWLTIIFVVLKLDPGGYLTSPVVGWSWWLVFSPIIVVWGLLLAVMLVVGLALLFAWLFDEYKRRKRRKASAKRRETLNYIPKK